MNTNIYNKVCAVVCATLLSANAIAQSDAPTMLITLKSGKTLEYKEFGKSSQIGFLPHDTVYTRPLSGDNLPELMAKDATISLFYEAMQATAMLDSITDYLYPDYHCSEDSTENGTCYSTAVEYDNVFYPEFRYKRYTVFTPQNDVFAAKGIKSLADLKTYAAQVYDAVYPEDAQVFDPKDRRNSLNRFVSYHMLDRMGYYYGLTAEDGGVLHNNFDRRNLDIADWYETMMPHSVLKCSFPSGSEFGLYINRRGVRDHEDYYGMQIRGTKVTAPHELTINNEAVNGIYHYIDDLLLYDRTTQFTVLNERWRLDCSTLSPDFMSSGARGHKVRGYGGNSEFPGYYGYSSSSADPDENPNTCLGFKAGSAKNFEFNDAETHLHVRPRYLLFTSYQADEVTISGHYDFSVKLPPLPEGEWELRFGTCIGFDNRGVVQFYIDDQACGEPFDMRVYGQDRSIGILLDGVFETIKEVKRFTNEYVEYVINQLYYDQVFAEVYKEYFDQFKEYNETDDSLYIDGMILASVKNEVSKRLRDYRLRNDVEHELYEKYMGPYDNKLEELAEKYFSETYKEGDDEDEIWDMVYVRAEEELKDMYHACFQKIEDDYYRDLHERGYMKGPAGYGINLYGDGTLSTMRDSYYTLRRVIGTIKSDGKSDHYLRVKQMLDTMNGTCDFDFIELCPKSIYDNPDLPEDIY